MIPVKHIDPEDLPLYAMQLLSPEEMAEITEHLQHSAEARRQLADIQGDLAILAHTAEMHSPPALARQRLMKHVAREKKPVPIDRTPLSAYAVQPASIEEEDATPISAGARILPWLGWAAAASIAFAGFYQYDQNQNLKSQIAKDQKQISTLSNQAETTRLVVDTLQDPTAMRVSLVVPTTTPAPQGRAAYDSEKGSLVFLASNLHPLNPYKTYELWLLPSNGHDPIAAGIFKPDSKGFASVILPQLPKGVSAKGFAVSIEDEGGAVSPTVDQIILASPTA